MRKLLAPFDRELNKVLETINMQWTLDIVLLEKSLKERNFCSNQWRIQLSGYKEPLPAGVEIRQHVAAAIMEAIDVCSN